MSKGRKEHHEEHVDETWLIPYADLLTLLLALFIILFAMSSIDAKKYDKLMQSLNSAFNGGKSHFETSSLAPVTKDPVMERKKKTKDAQPSKADLQKQYEKEQQDLEQLKHKLDQYIQDNKLNAALDTTLNNDLLMITIRDNALFDSGSAAVKPESRRLAASIADMLGQYPGYQIEVAGHTDNVPMSRGQFESNWDLSSARALNFMKILFENKSIEQGNFRSIGYGEYQPVDTNDSPDGRGKNRRVEVSILRGVKAAEVQQVGG